MTTLRYGSSGSEVKQLQELLNSTGLYTLAVDGNYGSDTETAVRQYQARSGLSIDGIVGTNTWSKLLNSGTQETGTGNTGYVQSQSVLDAAAALETAKAADPGEYTSTYEDNIQSLIDQALNREDFTYDVGNDPVYQQYSDMFIQGGKLAMQDAVGEAAQLSGGYGNSYAQTAGQQQYQNYMQQRAEIIPELWQTAYDMHAAEGNQLQSDLSMLQTAENAAYSKYRDIVGDYNTDLAYATDQYNTAYQTDYNKYLDEIAQSQWKSEYNLAVAQAAKKTSGSGGSSKGSTYSLLDDLQARIDSGEITEEQATTIMNQYYGIEEEEEKAIPPLTLTVEDDSWEWDETKGKYVLK